MTSWAQLNSSDSSPLADTRLGGDQGFNFQPRTWGCVTADSTSHAVGKGRKLLAHQPRPISVGPLTSGPCSVSLLGKPFGHHLCSREQEGGALYPEEWAPHLKLVIPALIPAPPLTRCHTGARGFSSVKYGIILNAYLPDRRGAKINFYLRSALKMRSLIPSPC